MIHHSRIQSDEEGFDVQRQTAAASGVYSGICIRSDSNVLLQSLQAQMAAQLPPGDTTAGGNTTAHLCAYSELLTGCLAAGVINFGIQTLKIIDKQHA
jgi:hypothetical protein